MIGRIAVAVLVVALVALCCVTARIFDGMLITGS